MSQGITEFVVEKATLTWVENLGWMVKHGPDIASGELAAKRDEFSHIVLVQRLRDALARLNPMLPAYRNPSHPGSKHLVNEQEGMFELTRGNLLDADMEAVVNTEGIMGKGIALQFRKASLENYEAYRRACKVGDVQPGCKFVFDRHTLTSPRYIINFSTKRHWRRKSRLEDIEAGLVALGAEVRHLGIRYIAVPPLGSGMAGSLGGRYGGAYGSI